MKILVAERDLGWRKWFIRILSSKKNLVVTSNDGQTAATRLRKRRVKFDLVITATQMPCMTGPDLLEDMKLRKIIIPVIGVSDQDADREHYEHFWLKKKSQAPALLALIRKLAVKSP